MVSRRSWLALILSFGTFNMYTLRVHLSMAIQPMSCEYNWSTSSQGQILSSFFVGYVFGNIPGGLFATKYGGKLIIALSVFVPALLTLLIPYATSSLSSYAALNCKCAPSIASDWCFLDDIYLRDEIKCNADHLAICESTPSAATQKMYMVMVCRALMGLFGGLGFPAKYALISNWAPTQERSSMLGYTVSGVYVANSITFSLCSFIINHSRWQNVFYLFGTLSIVWCLLLYVYVYDSPLDDPRISSQELQYLQRELNLTPSGKGKEKEKQKNQDQKAAIPWKEIVSDKCILSFFVCQFSYNWTFYTLLTQLPTYLNKELNYNLSQAGFVSIAPYIGQCVVTLSMGKLCDALVRSNKYSLSNIRKVNTVLASIVPAVLLVICGYSNNVQLIVLLLIIACSFMGCCTPGLLANMADVSDLYSSVICGVSNSIATLPGVLSPIFVGYILESPLFGRGSEWSTIFASVLVLNTIGTGIYCVFAHANPIPKLCAHSKQQ